MADIEKNIKDALLKKALGYDYEEKEMIADKTGNTGKVKITKKHVPPDVNAIDKILQLMICDKW